jgi:NADPH:quinone reductase-like Zn-dependent oxidoreductase
MKAITLKQNGSVENFAFAEIATPTIQPDQVLVQVKAIGINPVDAYVRQNHQGLLTYLKPQQGEDTFIVGWDISGVVVETGAEITQFKQGDAVFGLVNFPGHARAYAEYLAAPARHLALKPANVSHREAAGATLAALTAWQALVTYANVRPGDKVLIHAAGGGVGHYAVQIAKHFGAYVIGTASAGNRDFVLGLGADEFIDYKRERFEDQVKDADVVLDAIYGDHIVRSLEAVKKGGRLISLLAFIEGEFADKVKEKEVFSHRLSVVSNGEDMQQIAALLQGGQLRSHISQVYNFPDLPKAHQQVESGKTRGKVVVEL